MRVSPGGRKTWFVTLRTDDRQKRVPIGTYPAISLGEARDEARKIIRDAQLGLLTDSAKSPALTLGHTVPLFIQLYAKLTTEAGENVWRVASILIRRSQGEERPKRPRLLYRPGEGWSSKQPRAVGAQHGKGFGNPVRPVRIEQRGRGRAVRQRELRARGPGPDRKLPFDRKYRAYAFSEEVRYDAILE